MLNPDAHLHTDIFDAEKLEQAPTRDGFGNGAVEAGKADERVVVLCADLAESTRAEWFQKEFPERYIEMGVAEQNMATVASGLANYGKIPFITSYAAFSPGRNFEQIRTTIALNDVPVIVCGMHAGVSVGPDGATHQPLEDIAMMRALPNMIVVAPCDAEEARKATVAAAKLGKPVYLRFARANTPVFTTKETPFGIGKAEVFWKSENPQVSIVACGALVHNALLAARELEKEGVSVLVINSHTIKPLDEDTILKAVKETGAVVTVEEHQKIGGLGSAVAELLSQKLPTPIEFVGVSDQFGQSGEPEELIAHYGLDTPAIVRAVKRVVARQ
ncbi:MAG: transketolase C-terminal domain-containing protein [bacterium]|nr:transketolase C-terminal domain-containing protein [bacterium]